MKLITLIFSLFLVSCSNQHAGLTRIMLEDGGEVLVPLFVEIADDPAEQELGLMNRTELPEDQGMLFVFSEPRILTFWMKNTLIPLDILFFDAEGYFINIHTMNPCTKDPCQTYSSNGSATYALELSSGFYARRLQPLLQQRGEALRLRFAGE